jgi:hypothetical protein
LVPIGPGDGGMRYQAVFSRFIRKPRLPEQRAMMPWCPQ